MTVAVTAADVTAGPWVQATLNWCALVDEDYPRGRIDFYPATKGGITGTFPHQRYNGEAKKGGAWRQGNICLGEVGHVLGGTAQEEPHEVATRLAWYVQRCQQWMVAASHGELNAPGSPYELPDFDVPDGRGPVVGYASDAANVTLWSAHTPAIGRCKMAGGPTDESLWISEFLDGRGHQIERIRWGPAIQGATKYTGVWVTLPSAPTIEPWQAPITWSELRECLKAQGHDDEQVIDALVRASEGQESATILVGWPVAEREGETPTCMHWQAGRVALPKPPERGQRHPRPQPTRHWLRTLNQDVQWLPSVNCNPDQTHRRGGLPDTLRAAHVLILGGGSLGSSVAHLLVRGGVRNLTIMDADHMVAGNLVRHHLDLGDIGNQKGTALAAQLARENPIADVRGVDEDFPPADPQTLREFDLLIDCTGQDDTIYALADWHWTKVPVMVSLSINDKATKLLFYAVPADNLVPDDFGAEALRVLGRPAGEKLPWGPTGCFNPVFPAPWHRIVGLASLAVARLDDTLRNCTKAQSDLIEYPGST